MNFGFNELLGLRIYQARSVNVGFSLAVGQPNTQATCRSAVETKVTGPCSPLRLQSLVHLTVNTSICILLCLIKCAASRHTTNFVMEIANFQFIKWTANCLDTSDITDFRIICNVILFPNWFVKVRVFCAILFKVYLIFLLKLFLSYSDWVTLMVYCQCFFIKKFSTCMCVYVCVLGIIFFVHSLQTRIIPTSSWIDL